MSEALTGAYRYYQLTRFRERETHLLTQTLSLHDFRIRVVEVLTELIPA